MSSSNEKIEASNSKEPSEASVDLERVAGTTETVPKSDWKIPHLPKKKQVSFYLIDTFLFYNLNPM